MTISDMKDYFFPKKIERSNEKYGSSKQKKHGKAAVKKRQKRTAAYPSKKQRMIFGKAKKTKNIVENILFALFVILCFYFLFNYRSHKVDGPSMEPALHNGEHLLTHKNKEISRYDIITFEPKEAPGDSYVKRVIGMPGDLLYLEGTTLYFLEKESSSQNFSTEAAEGNLPDSTQIFRLTEEGAEILRTVTKIPEHTYFVLGDNRGNSKDSRAFGLIEEQQIEGVVSVRFYPFKKIGIVH